MADKPKQPGKVIEPDIEIDLVQGIMPGSKNEYYFALALDKLDYDYYFQYQVGAAGIRGSQRIDFIVFVAGQQKACFIQGMYWHTTHTKSEDDLKHAVAEQRFGIGNVIDFNDDETKDVATSINSIRKKL